jgi:hypothetical protein
MRGWKFRQDQPDDLDDWIIIGAIAFATATVVWLPLFAARF